MAKSNVLPVVAMALGLAFLAASLVWSHFVDPKAYWTDDQAERRAESGVLVKVLPHRLAHAATEAERKRIQSEINKATSEYGQTDADLQLARDRLQRPITLLRWSGTLCLLAGVVAYYVLRGHDE
jgi:hypothetical protein